MNEELGIPTLELITALKEMVRQFHAQGSQLNPPGRIAGSSQNNVAPICQALEVTSSTADTYGYPARIQTYDGTNWSDTYAECRAVQIGSTIAGAVLATGFYPIGRLMYVSPTGLHVYGVHPGTAGAGATWEELDGSPSYASRTRVIVDQTDGLQLSEPAANQVRVDILDASGTQKGNVNLGPTNQVMGDGPKSFQESVTVNTDKASSQPLRVWGDGATDPVMLAQDDSVTVGGTTDRAFVEVYGGVELEDHIIFDDVNHAFVGTLAYSGGYAPAPAPVDRAEIFAIAYQDTSRTVYLNVARGDTGTPDLAATCTLGTTFGVGQSYYSINDQGGSGLSNGGTGAGAAGDAFVGGLWISAGSGITEAAQDAVGAMVGTSLVYVDGTPLLARAALTGDVTAAQDSNATTLVGTANVISVIESAINYVEGTWAPTFTNLTEVGGAATVTGRYTRIGRMVYFVVTVLGVVTTAAAAGVTYCDLPIVAAFDDTCDTVDRTTNVGIGNGVLDATNDRCYPAAWAATGDLIVFSGKYEV